MGLEEEFSKFTHEVEEKFHDVKEHVLLSVERQGVLIAFVLMSVTSAILLIGTIYVWCFHRGSSHHEEPHPANETKPESVGDNQQESASTPESSAHTSDQNGKVRKRIPSSGSSAGNMNNNESPVKSKIPIRTKK